MTAANPRRRGSRWLAQCLATSAVLAGVLAPPAAQANLTLYWKGTDGDSGPAGSIHADDSRSLLTASDAFATDCSYCEIWAGAHYAGGYTLYANWATAIGHACHHYGTNNIGAMYQTPNSVFHVQATAGWHGALPDWYC